MQFLEKIVSAKKEDIATLKAKKPFKSIQQEALSLIGKRDMRVFKDIFLPGHLALIAEIKLASPSEGLLTRFTCPQIARLYAKSQADAISVLTERKYFSGDLRYLKETRRVTTQPILRKDFIIDAYQIYETFLAYADSFLLLASILSTRQLKRFLTTGRMLGLEALVEIHNEEELDKAIDADAAIIGINNRDLTTFNIDMATTIRLAEKIPKDKIIISESGFDRPEQVEEIMGTGVRGILVGTSILKSEDPIKKISELREAADRL